MGPLQHQILHSNVIKVVYKYSLLIDKGCNITISDPKVPIIKIFCP